MADLETLKDLLARVRKEGGPNPLLDERIFAAVRGWSYPLHGAAWIDFKRRPEEVRYTASIDAAIDWVADELPGWRWVIHSPRSGLSYGCSLTDPKRAGCIVVAEKEHPTAPLAICAALLSALIAQAEQEASDGLR